jgi:DNA-binding Lrp family transcriptional regulator
MKLDATDLRILAELQAHGALSNVELARRVHLSPSPCLARVKALEHNGVINRYVALANAAALGLGLNVFISISLKEQSKAALAEFEQRIAEHDEVMECYLMTGDSDYLMRVALPEANPSIYLTLSLGVTFPFNLTVGIPLYVALASAVMGG